MQRLDEPDETKWRCRIIPNRVIESASRSEADSRIRLNVVDSRDFGDNQGKNEIHDKQKDSLDVDYVFAATGYVHNAHESILAPAEHLLPLSCSDENETSPSRFRVARDYRVQFDEDKVDSEQAGIWLQGCNESTHGVCLPRLAKPNLTKSISAKRYITFNLSHTRWRIGSKYIQKANAESSTRKRRNHLSMNKSKQQFTSTRYGTRAKFLTRSTTLLVRLESQHNMITTMLLLAVKASSIHMREQPFSEISKWKVQLQLTGLPHPDIVA